MPLSHATTVPLTPAKKNVCYSKQGCYGYSDCLHLQLLLNSVCKNTHSEILCITSNIYSKKSEVFEIYVLSKKVYSHFQKIIRYKAVSYLLI